MKNAYEVLQQKETDLARVRHEIESLWIVASLLADESPSEELTKKRARSAEETLDQVQALKVFTSYVVGTER